VIQLLSPAKINLFLRILKKRTDGFHELASLFQAIDLSDKLEFSLSTQDILTCNNPHIPVDSRNLILKAVELFRKKTGIKFAVEVKLEKNIPHEAGLGGGSGNAATTLWALNQLLQKPASLEDLISWSAELGSDITFFLSEGTAFCTGRGELIENLKPFAKQKLWIAKPAEGLSTALVFNNLNLNTLENRDPLKILEHFATKPEYFNDLEETAFKLSPSLREYKENLLELGFENVCLSGSGTAFFCLGQPPIENLSKEFTLIPVSFINRTKDHWYQ
jgi:4-diphosphocytidyl-2-C-methyl-D-erythritol kinase